MLSERLYVRNKSKNNDTSFTILFYVKSVFFFHCSDCPAGYYGNNCTDKCKHPTFGLLCLETCDCPVCNHIVGCISTVVNKGNVEVVCC